MWCSPCRGGGYSGSAPTNMMLWPMMTVQLCHLMISPVLMLLPGRIFSTDNCPTISRRNLRGILSVIVLGRSSFSCMIGYPLIHPHQCGRSKGKSSCLSNRNAHRTYVTDSWCRSQFRMAWRQFLTRHLGNSRDSGRGYRAHDV